MCLEVVAQKPVGLIDRRPIHDLNSYRPAVWFGLFAIGRAKPFGFYVRVKHTHKVITNERSLPIGQCAFEVLVESGHERTDLTRSQWLAVSRVARLASGGWCRHV